jgi:hypothetical protein
MLVSLLLARAGARRLGTRTILPLALAACSDGGLFLPDEPDDRAPVQLRVVSGTGQSAVAGSAVPHPLVAQALDRADRPVEGAVIRFKFVGRPDGAVITPPAPETDSSGQASVEVTLGTPAGDQPVDALLDGPESVVSVRFLLTAIPSNSGGGGSDDDDDPPPDDGDGGGGGGGQVDDGGNGGGGEGDDEDGGDGKGKGNKGKGKGHHGSGGGDDENGGGNGDD